MRENLSRSIFKLEASVLHKMDGVTTFLVAESFWFEPPMKCL